LFCQPVLTDLCHAFLETFTLSSVIRHHRNSPTSLHDVHFHECKLRSTCNTLNSLDCCELISARFQQLLSFGHDVQLNAGVCGEVWRYGFGVRN
jgi:hypothetical protein